MDTLKPDSYVPSDVIKDDVIKDDSISSVLPELQNLLNDSFERMFDADYFVAIGEELRQLHARLRIHHASDYFPRKTGNNEPILPELVDELYRLRGEHTQFLGNLDRLIRSVDSIVDCTMEDRDVFLLRIKELLSMIYRHEAEEDRLLYLAVWRDTGGES